MSHSGKIIEGKVDEFKGKLQAKFGDLTDQDFEEAKGNLQVLKGKLKKEYGYAANEIEEYFDSLNNSDALINFKQKAEKIWGTAKENVKEATDKVSDKVKDATDKVKETLQNSAETIKNQSANVQDSFVNYVQENPVKAVSFALVIGALVAGLVSKKK